MSRRQDFGRVSVEGAVVDVDGEVNGAREAEIRSVGSDRGVSEEECASDEGTDHHGVSGELSLLTCLLAAGSL